MTWKIFRAREELIGNTRTSPTKQQWDICNWVFE